MATFLKPYKLEIISTMLALMALGSMVGWPLWRLGKNLHKRGRLPDMKMVRVTISASVVAAVVLGFFFLPLPVSRVRQTGLVEFQPDAVEKVPVLVPGTPVKIFVEEGQFVRKGAELATFISFELQKKESSLVAKIEEQSRLRDDYQRQLTQSGLPDETADQIRTKVREAEGQKELMEKQLVQLSDTKKKLLLKAPRDGVVIGLPKKDEQYRPWDRSELEKPFCHIADPTKLRIIVPVSPDDFELIRTDKARKARNGENLEVTLRVHGFAGQLWSGRVSHLPRSADKTVPLQLTTKGGGPLAMKPGSDPNNPEPQSQVYLVGIDFETPPDKAISPGALGQAKIHCEYRSAAWWTWRTLSATFDLGLW
jgi:putative peptide zinc metalloprotease protein